MTKIIRPGQIISWGAVPICSCALDSMLPQDGIGGWMPRPRKDRIDSNRMMPPTDSVVATMIGETTLGRMWTNITRLFDAPSAWAARTNSRAFIDRVEPRTSRATPVQPTIEMIATMR